MNLFRRVVAFLFGRSLLEPLLKEARQLGRVTLAETDLEQGLGWYVTIRPGAGRSLPGDRTHRYSWSGQSLSLVEALKEAIEEAKEYPDMKNLTHVPHAPRLGGKEYDDE